MKVIKETQHDLQVDIYGIIYQLLLKFLTKTQMEMLVLLFYPP